MIKKVLLAATAAFVVGGMSSASALTVEYTFTGYCDGIKLKEVAGVATGTHLGKSCAGKEGAFAGGFSGKRVEESDDTQWVITTSDPLNTAGTEEVFVLDQTAMTWTVWLENGSTGAFVDFNSGTLTAGAPPNDAPEGKALKSAGAGATK
jgi:hypothetical protein